MRGKAIGVKLGTSYRDYLTSVTPASNANADIVSFFFRRAFDSLRTGGALGLIATKTISKGDTRKAGLRYICTHGGTIYSARKRLKWPGSAAVVVSILHIVRGPHDAPVLDGIRVPLITAFLFSQGGHEDPIPLTANAGISFNGCALAGVGFTFDDDGSRATSLSEMRELIAKEPKNAERVFPYLGGDDLTRRPRAHPPLEVSEETREHRIVPAVVAHRGRTSASSHLSSNAVEVHCLRVEVVQRTSRL